MTSYKVETLTSNTKSWEGQITIKPEYIMSVMKFRKRWWFPWSHNEYGVICNLRKAEKEAEAKAKHHAKALFYHVPTKIIKVTELNGQKDSVTIWQNGKALDKKRWSVLRRFWFWLKQG